MNKIYIIIILSFLSGCASKDPPPIDYSTEFNQSDGKDFKYRILHGDKSDHKDNIDLMNELEKEFRTEQEDNLDDDNHNIFDQKTSSQSNKAHLFTIYPAIGKIIKKFTKGPNGFDAIIFSSPKGSVIKSVSEGSIIYSGFDPKFGNIVIVQNVDLQIAYGYIKEIIIKKGSKVKTGDIIGYIGDIANTKSSGLYFAVRKKNIALDPETLFKK